MLFSALLRTGLYSALFYCLAGSCWHSLAGEIPAPARPFQPKIAPASNEGDLAMKAFNLQPGFKAELFAAEPHLANPVAFDIDHQNRFWVAETFRLHAGVTDIRQHRAWLDEDLASQSADERLALMKRHEGTRFPAYEENSERLKLVLDLDKDGKADESKVFAENFSTALDGIASGVLARGNKVYFANVPNLWLLEDTNGDGVADQRRSLHYGYGVRVGFLGHDLHGLIMGPDGRLYFTIGDRGASIEIAGKKVGHPETGAVFRCNPDGSDLEVFAYGLRNPQEIAFDEFGNLFTGDNNSDGGDRARLVYLVEGGDSGWRIGFQFIEQPNSRGPWNAERMWHPRNPAQPAYIVPPIANMTDGPSGLAYYPGTGLPEKYKKHFFLVDFHGGRSSGIHSFELRPKGAFFELADAERFVWDALPTDVAFGPGPGIYFTDWVQGWGMTGKGRIYRLFEPSLEDDSLSKETQSLLGAGFQKRSLSELGKLLAHVDMRVRQEAQFELVNRGAKGGDKLASVARKNAPLLARLHAIWGIGQLARQGGSQEKAAFARILRTLSTDPEPEVRTQTAKVIGDAELKSLSPEINRLVLDQNERVQVQAAVAAGKLQEAGSVEALLALLEKTNNQDPVVRHAASYALARIGDMDELGKASAHSSPAVRMGVLLAMRRLERAEIARFLSDKDPAILLEAARAINDVPISGAIGDLAFISNTEWDRAELNTPELLRRVVNANYRFGTRESAANLARLAQNQSVPEVARVEALKALADWETPSGRDMVTGLWRPMVGPRSRSHAIEAVEPALVNLLANSPGAVRAAAASLATRLQLTQAADALFRNVADNNLSTEARVAALRALADFKHDRLPEAIALAQQTNHEELRKEALRIHSLLQPSGALEQIATTLKSGTVGEKQSAFGTLGNMPGRAADELVAHWLDRLLEGKLQPELHLDLLEAAAKRKTPEIQAKLQAHEAQVASGGALAPFQVALLGGNRVEGRRIFIERAEAACLRCHKIQGENSEGGQVGPELTGIGSKKSREYLLESLVFPNKTIAEGFQNVIIITKDGTSYAGVVQSETEAEVVLNSPEDGLVTIKKAEITAREQGLSSMPEGLATLLSKRDLRDLVEYLSSLK